jgi:succinate dehydrogenase / fumarate reductase cytochrome b subunit
MAAKILLKKLFIANQTINTQNHDIGFENYIFNPEAFTQRFAFILAQAGKNGEIIIALENSSYYSLQYAKNYISNNSYIKNKIEKKLNSLELTTDFLAKVVHIDGVLLTKNVIDGIEKNAKQMFEGFKAAVYTGPYLDFNSNANNDLNRLFDAIKLSRVYFDRELCPHGYDIHSYAPKIAEKMAGAILSDAFDSGADFIITNDIRTFYMFDTCRKKIEKEIGRQIPLYILTMPQVVLLALGEKDKKLLGFNAHKVKPTILK